MGRSASRSLRSQSLRQIQGHRRARISLGRAIPAGFGVDGYFCRHQKHVIYWKLLSDGKIGIVTILHERMHQIERLKDDLHAGPK